jgi:phosphohistidine phosphatase SixA
MKKCIVIRHANYDDTLTNEPLNNSGKTQITKIASYLSNIITPDCKVKLLTSPALRAKNSAELLSSIIAIQFECCEDLWVNPNQSVEAKSVVNEILKAYTSECDILILISHLEYCNEFPYYISKQILKEPIVRLCRFSRGEMGVLDIEKRSFNLYK